MNTRVICSMALCLAPTMASAQALVAQEQGAVIWRCGGVGVEERDELAKMEAGSNLKLVFAAGARGEYLANVQVAISERQSKVAAIKFVAEGPICLVKAPAGSYRVDASVGDRKSSVSATIAEDASRPAMMVLRFPAGD
ncbi:MAG TPA: hypothetical protein VI195_06230 [Steroidobacteraceae bacterium]